jgi:hypothetical protein
VILWNTQQHYVNKFHSQDGKIFKKKKEEKKEVNLLLTCTVLCCAVLCCAVLCCAVFCCVVLCCAVDCCTTVVSQFSNKICSLSNLPLFVFSLPFFALFHHPNSILPSVKLQNKNKNKNIVLHTTTIQMMK